ncbi:MAG: 30S ribosome-binding factor RbfA [Candidatus Kapaibacteriota bacterium]
MQSFRTERVAKEIRKILASSISFLGNELGGGLVSITTVVVSKDFSIAKVYISVYGTKVTPLEVINYLNENKSVYRSEVAAKLKIRNVPDIKFFFDDTLDEIEHIQKLFKTANPDKDNKSIE